MRRFVLKNRIATIFVVFLSIAGVLTANVDRALAQALSCAAPGSASWSTGSFVATDFTMNGVSVNSNGNLELNTGNSALNPNSIVVPFEQTLNAVFIVEGAGYISDFGWFLKAEAEEKLGGPISGSVNYNDLVSNGVTLNYLFHNIKDDGNSCCDGGDGILDKYYNDSGLYLGSSSGLTEAQLQLWGFSPTMDGVVRPNDMRKVMGKFAAGTEIVFFLLANGDKNRDWYTKDGWSSDTWNNATQTLVLELDKCAPDTSGSCNPSSWSGSTRTQGWLSLPAVTRLDSYFNLTMSGTKSISLTNGSPFNHYVVGAPPTDPNRWILGLEDLSGGGDGDYNDLTILIERETGGVAELLPANAIGPSDPNAFISTASIKVHDFMPSTSCNGNSQINYHISVDAGASWTEITDWHLVQTPTSGGAEVTGWTYGDPEETYREASINFAELGITGRELTWKAEIISDNDACIPEIYSVDIDYTASLNAEYSRSAPITLANVIYSASYETPDITWTDPTLRGHFRSTELYDPAVTTASTNITNWDAGAKLNSRSPSSRKMLMPNVTAITPVVNELSGTISGTSVTSFTGNTSNTPLIPAATTITATINGSPVIFTETRTGVLTGTPMGDGTINRTTGEFTINTVDPMDDATQVTVDYTYFVVASDFTTFDSATTDMTDFGITDEGSFGATGFEYKYDFNDDGAVDENDADWLANWIRGYKDGSSLKKEWVLGAIDHSAPAVVGAPGLTSWYFGSDVTTEEKTNFDIFRCQQRERPTVAFVGARDGQLHAFYAGEFRPYYIDPTFSGTCDSSTMADFWAKTNSATCINEPCYLPPSGPEILINKGYYDWQERSNGSGPLTSDSDNAANYGNGYEMYSIIPNDLLTKFKNNVLKEDGGAFMDASPSASHVRFADGSWHTVLLTAEGNGGDAVYGVDITDPTDPSFLWTFFDPDLFRSISSPSVGSIGRIQTSSGAKWIAMFVSGVSYDNTLDPSIFILDVETGEVIKRLYLDTESAGLGGTPSGQPALVDSDGNGYVDRFYIGTDKGFVYKGTLPDDPTASVNSITACTFFDTANGAGGRQPLYASPAVYNQTTQGTSGFDYNVDVFFGTSDNPVTDDYIPGTTYYFYGVRDTDDKGACSSGSAQWEYALPAGQRVFASAFASAGKIYFGTTTADTDDPCALPVSDAGGTTGGIYVLDTSDGTVDTSLATEGNVTTTPLVDDEHLYIKTDSGELKGIGGNTFQNKSAGGAGKAKVNSWIEIVQ